MVAVPDCLVTKDNKKLVCSCMGLSKKKAPDMDAFYLYQEQAILNLELMIIDNGFGR